MTASKSNPTRVGATLAAYGQMWAPKRNRAVWLRGQEKYQRSKLWHGGLSVNLLTTVSPL